jgi:predicted dehydrogenase
VNDSKLPLAVLGCGAVAAGHYLPTLAASRRFTTALLVDRDLGRARALADRWGVSDVATDVAEVPGRVAAAVVALPNYLHAPVAIDLLHRGVHVLVEKPMATAPADCDAMLAAAREGGATLAVGLQFRAFDSSRWVRQALAGDLLGALQRFDLRLGVVSNWPFASDFVLRRETAGGGVLVDYGVHVLDLLLHWLGDLAVVRYRHDAMGGVESDCEIELATATGVPGRVEISRSRNLRNTSVFTGARASLEVGIWDPDPPIVLRRGDGGVDLVGRARVAGEPGLDFNGAFLRSLDDFADAIETGRPPMVSGEQGRRSVALIAACYARAEPLELAWLRPAVLAGDRR